MLVHKKQLNHNKDSFVHQSRFLANQIANEIAIPNGLANTPHPSLCTACSPHYNLFTSTMPEVYYLYKDIQEFFKTEICQTDQGYWIVGWLNYWPNKGEVLDWHGHDYGGGANCFHGIYGVNCEPSYAEYREIGTEDIVEKIENKNGQLLITTSTNIEHRISDWNEDEPRITIAFNIQPIDTMLQHIQTPKVNPANKVGLQLHQDNLRMNQPGGFMPGGNPLNYYVPL